MYQYRKIWTLLFLCSTALISQGLLKYPQKMIVNVAVADLRAIPQANDPDLALPTSDLDNPLEMSQLLLGEHILAYKETVNSAGETWLKISALQQERHGVVSGWHGYPGWIQADQVIPVSTFPTYNLVVHSLLADLFDQQGEPLLKLSIGTRLNGNKKIHELWEVMLPNGTIAYINDSDIYFIDEKICESEDELRQAIITTALEFVGSWYSWGGRSAQNDQIAISSVDCSALINLSFLAHGLQIPRMSHDQFLKSSKIEHGKDLKPGDLVFFNSVKKQSTHMDHVMLYLGNNILLETTFAGEHKARLIPFDQRVGQPCMNIESGDLIDAADDQFFVYFGSYFQDTALLQELRDNARS